ncbi:glycosyl hydrolase family 17 [Flavobacteriaceae bacterium R38]|nr:glycosyl hydrolase family 17 [Flavobacteriaceae bacterium R38]
MKKMKLNISICIVLAVFILSCKDQKKEEKIMQTQQKVTAEDILGNPEYLAVSYGGYRANTRNIQPTIEELKEDLKILHAMGIKVLRTYNVQPKLPHASNILKAIRALKNEDSDFEMYVMLGAWINCLNAWTDKAPDHNVESPDNALEIERAVALANAYPDIVKIIAVGNEAMVKWATSYYVQPGVILKWVNHLQNLKSEEKLPKELWITSSDNFASWGGGTPDYHTDDLNQLIEAVDFISMHTYPMHDTHYNPSFWGVSNEELTLSKSEQIEEVMQRAMTYAKSQYESVREYMLSLGVNKPIHIGETGWASYASELYGDKGSKATDEYKQGLYYKYMRDWTNKNKMACFYFEAFNESWKDAANPLGSENHFGLFTIDGKAKYAIWDLVDQKVFEGLGRDGNTIEKTYNGDIESLIESVLIPGEKDTLIPEYSY